MQHMIYNADVNVRILGGLNTFHAMGGGGGMQCIAPATSIKTQVKVERKIRSYPKKNFRRGLGNVVVKDYSTLKGAINSSDFTLTTFPLNSIWLSGINNQPGWYEFMNIISSRK
ncbi:hypothetical protein PR048_020184 [Dryococelus australis]|uniref:Uncharacterized protein n=1 Tax=Dryococelus australis TaxID=614101 RepID=A0ABQ9H5T6_9NEOP|nr:hypothetical protein PR048_020184 [Dryococelus australis]